MERIFHSEAIELLQNEEFIEMVKNRKVIIVTDPPFNIGYKYGKYKDNVPQKKNTMTI